jgi:hypothetical protein
MSIKYTPKDLLDHHKYKTRKKIKDSTYASKDLIAKASQSMSLANQAEQQLSKIDIPYIRNLSVVYYSQTKIVLISDKEILKSKVSQLHTQLLQMLNNNSFFSKLKRIEIQISHPNKYTAYTGVNSHKKDQIKAKLSHLKEISK